MGKRIDISPEAVKRLALTVDQFTVEAGDAGYGYPMRIETAARIRDTLRALADHVRSADLPSDRFVPSPDNTVGVAYLDRKGFPFADTVCSTERGAMVNYLVTVCQITPMADWSDAKIKAQFERYKMGGSVGPVSIERLIVEPAQ